LPIFFKTVLDGPMNLMALDSQVSANVGI